MNDNPYVPHPPDAPWDPSSFFQDEGWKIVGQLFGHLIRRAPDSVTEYLLFRTGASLIWSSSKHQFISEAVEVYVGLFDQGMKLDPKKLMATHVLASKEYAETHETLIAASSASEEDDLTVVDRGYRLLAYYSRLFECWRLLAAVPALAKELVTGTAGAKSSPAQYVAHDATRESILSLAAVVPTVAPHPINRLVSAVNRHLRNATYHKAGVKIRGRNPPIFMLRDRQWKREMDIDQLESAARDMQATVDALQAGLLVTRINYRDEYNDEVRSVIVSDERQEAQFIEMAAAHNGFHATAVQFSSDEVKITLRLLPGAFSYEETTVEQYQRQGGRVSRSVRKGPAFVWSTVAQVAKVLSAIAATVRGKGLHVAVEGRDGEHLGRFTAPSRLTRRLGEEGFGTEQLLQSGENRLVDRAPFDNERDRRKKEV